jgi:predicted ATPase
LSGEVIDEIVERTDGVPLFLEELTKAVIETAVAGRELMAIPAASATVPATLHASLLATALLMLGGRTPVCAWWCWKR